MLRSRSHPGPRTSRLKPLTQFFVIAVLLAAVVAFGSITIEVPGASSNPSLQTDRLSLPGLASAVPGGGASELTGAPTALTVVAPRVEHVPIFSNDALEDRTADEMSAMEERVGDSAMATSIIESGSSNERIPIFFEYETQEGDTMGDIADRFGVGSRYIQWNNVDTIDNSDALPVGIVLQIPSVEGIIHSVRVDETVDSIAERYDADPEEIVEFRANGFEDDPGNISEGSQILVPGGRIVPTEPSAPSAPSAPTTPDSPEPSAPPVSPGGGWVYPSDSRMLSSPFGPYHPLGIDWSMPIGSPVYAASDGQVVFVGGNPCCSYGYHIIINHGNGYESLYAHLNQFAVSSGSQVSAGQVIGYSGNTGRSTGPHLHFEIRRHGIYIDPMIYLP